MISSAYSEYCSSHQYIQLSTPQVTKCGNKWYKSVGYHKKLSCSGNIGVEKLHSFSHVYPISHNFISFPIHHSLAWNAASPQKTFADLDCIKFWISKTWCANTDRQSYSDNASRWWCEKPPMIDGTPSFLVVITILTPRAAERKIPLLSTVQYLAYCIV